MTSNQWMIAIIGAAVGSFMLRATPFLSKRLYELGKRHARFLTYVSFAVAAGIISRSIFLTQGNLDVSVLTWIKVIAVLITLIVFRYLPNISVALLAGIGAAMIIHAWWF